MRRFGPAMIDRRLKRKQTRREVGRDAVEDQLPADDSTEPCVECGAETYRFGGYCSQECEILARDRGMVEGEERKRLREEGLE